MLENLNGTLKKLLTAAEAAEERQKKIYGLNEELVAALSDHESPLVLAFDIAIDKLGDKVVSISLTNKFKIEIGSNGSRISSYNFDQNGEHCSPTYYCDEGKKPNTAILSERIANFLNNYFERKSARSIDAAIAKFKVEFANQVEDYITDLTLRIKEKNGEVVKKFPK